MSRESYYSDGRQGGELLIGTDTATGSFRKIKVINETVFAGLTDSSIMNIGDITSLTIPAGVEIGGNFTSIQLTSGAVIAYRA